MARFSGSIIIRSCPLLLCRFPCPGPDVHCSEIMRRSARLAARKAESHPAVQQGQLSRAWQLYPISFFFLRWNGESSHSTYKHLAQLLSEKWSSPYSVVMGWLCCSLGFSLLCSSIMCIHGSRSRSKHPGVPPAIDLAIAKGNLPFH